MGQNQDVPKKILEKIQKLLNLAEGAKAIDSLAEAELAATRAQELLIKYNLSLEQVEEGTVLVMVDREIIKTMGFEKKSDGTWVSDLWSAIAKNNFCKILYKGRGKWYIVLIGEEHNRLIVKDLVESFIPRIRALAPKYRKEYLENIEEGTQSWMIEKKGTWRRGFFRGAVEGIRSKLAEHYEELKQESEEINKMALVKMDKIEVYMSEKYPKLKYTTQTKSSGTSGREQGFKIGKSMNLNRGVGGRSGHKLLN